MTCFFLFGRSGLPFLLLSAQAAQAAEAVAGCLPPAVWACRLVPFVLAYALWSAKKTFICANRPVVVAAGIIWVRGAGLSCRRPELAEELVDHLRGSSNCSVPARADDLFNTMEERGTSSAARGNSLFGLFPAQAVVDHGPDFLLIRSGGQSDPVSLAGFVGATTRALVVGMHQCRGGGECRRGVQSFRRHHHADDLAGRLCPVPGILRAGDSFDRQLGRYRGHPEPGGSERNAGFDSGRSQGQVRRLGSRRPVRHDHRHGRQFPQLRRCSA